MKIIAGETIHFTAGSCQIKAKVEDASKGDIFSVKIESLSGDCGGYQTGGVYEFDRNLLAD